MTPEETNDLRHAVEVLRAGGVILYPTDTVWGLGCDATNPDAVAKIYKIKRRADSKALITLVGSEVQLERTVGAVPEVAWQLIDCADRPVTIVYDRPCAAAGIAPNLLADDGTLAVRLTGEEFSRELCRRFGRPLVSTSANISGTEAPDDFARISPEITAAVDYVCTSGRDRAPGQPSMVIRLSEGGLFKILRS